MTKIFFFQFLGFDETSRFNKSIAITSSYTHTYVWNILVYLKEVLNQTKHDFYDGIQSIQSTGHSNFGFKISSEDNLSLINKISKKELENKITISHFEITSKQGLNQPKSMQERIIDILKYSFNKNIYFKKKTNSQIRSINEKQSR